MKFITRSILIVIVLLYTSGSNLVARDDTAYAKEMEKRFTSDNMECRSTINNLRLRREPKLDSEKIRIITKNDKLKVSEIGDYALIDGKYGRWIKVQTSNNEAGWCFDGFLQTNFDHEDDNVEFTKVKKIIRSDDMEYILLSHPVSAVYAPYEEGEGGCLSVAINYALVSRNIKTNKFISTYYTEDRRCLFIDIEFKTLFNRQFVKLSFIGDPDSVYSGYTIFRYFELDNGKLTNVFFQCFDYIGGYDGPQIKLAKISTVNNKMYLTYEFSEYIMDKGKAKGNVIIEYTYENSLTLTGINSDVKMENNPVILLNTKESLNDKFKNIIEPYVFLF